MMQRRDFLIGAAAAGVAAGCATPAGEGGEPIEAAFLYGFPIYEFVRTQQLRTGPSAGAAGASLNRIAHRPNLADHTSRQVTSPNNDTLYSSAFLELSGGPVELGAPTDTSRYWSVALMDLFTDNFAYVGTRATKGEGGRFWIVGPEWRESPPAGIKLLRSTTNDVWLLGRVVVDGPQDLPNARALQQKITVTLPPQRPAARPYSAVARNVEDPSDFLGIVNEGLARSPGEQGHTRRAARFRSLGLGAGVTPTSAQLDAWREYLPQGLAQLRESSQRRQTVIDGWAYQERGVGDFGTNDRLRASTALWGLAALGEEEAMYFHALVDGAGQPLTGSNRYVWTVPPGGLPVDAFWSLTMYQGEPDGRFFFVDNPIKRYAIGDRTQGLVRSPDGGVDVLIQSEPPEGPLAANWLPAPAGPMRLSLRTYLPRKEVRDRAWRVPPVRRV
jgi:hypothetical protein